MSVKITVRVPLELKKRMDMFAHINWSEVVRKAIERRIYEEEIKHAIEVMEEISSKAKAERPIADIIRKFRDER